MLLTFAFFVLLISCWACWEFWRAPIIEDFDLDFEEKEENDAA